MNQFLEQFKEHFHKRRLVRWFMFTYPKTTALLTISFIAPLSYEFLRTMKEESQFYRSFNESIHSTSTQTRRNNKIVIYDGANK